MNIEEIIINLTNSELDFLIDAIDSRRAELAEDENRRQEEHLRELDMMNDCDNCGKYKTCRERRTVCDKCGFR